MGVAIETRKKVWTEAELQSLPEIDGRLRDFVESGTQIAWIIDPDQKRVEVCHSLTRLTLIGAGGFVEREHLLPGFRYPIPDLFKEWDWE